VKATDVVAWENHGRQTTGDVLFRCVLLVEFAMGQASGGVVTARSRLAARRLRLQLCMSVSLTGRRRG
jgi:hypothetical protein